MPVVRIPLGSRSYPVVIGNNILNTYPWKRHPASAYVIVTDTNVRHLVADRLASRLRLTKRPVLIFALPSGEKSKRLHTIETLARKLAKQNIDRNALFVSVGGGVIGDITGFLASTYKRGVRYIHVPTTFLAQVDSSLGGKNGLNLTEGKNLIGTIYQPTEVIADVSVLQKLPAIEFRNGLAELIKYGMIADAKLFRRLETNIERRDADWLIELVTQSARIKAMIVSKDESDQGLRNILNFGHTVGHAIETACHNAIPHGQAIAIGMVAEGAVAVRRGTLEDRDWSRLVKLIRSAGLPVTLEDTGLKVATLVRVMQTDKKTHGGVIRIVIPSGIGSVLSQKDAFTFPIESKEFSSAFGSLVRL